MNARSVFAVVAAALVSGSAWAVEATQLPEQENATTPAKAQQMPRECAKAPVKRHDHGAERGLAIVAAKAMSMMPCEMEHGAARADGKTGKVLRHDHGKFHKNQ